MHSSQFGLPRNITKFPRLPQHKSRANNSLEIVKYHTRHDLYPIFSVFPSEEKRGSVEQKSFQFNFSPVN